MRIAFAVVILAASAALACGKLEYGTPYENPAPPGSAALFVRARQNATPAYQHPVGSLAFDRYGLLTAGTVVSWPDDGRSVTTDPTAPSGLYFLNGSVITARGTLQAAGYGGHADEVLVRCVLRGVVESHTASSLQVAGVDVRLAASTIILDGSGGPVALAAIPDGARVEVHGWPETAARVRASLVRVLPGSPAVLVRGWARAAPAGNTFELSLVRGGPATLRVEAAGTPLQGVAAGALVRVSGDVLVPGSPPTLQATSVAVESQVLPRDGDTVLLEGVLTGGPGTLWLDDLALQTSSATTWSGSTLQEPPQEAITTGTHVWVTAAQRGTATVASSITAVDLLAIAGRIAPGSLAVGNPATYAVFTLSSQSVVVDTSTTIVTPTGQPISIAELASQQSGSASGLAVIVHGYPRADGDVQAQRVEVTAL